MSLKNETAGEYYRIATYYCPIKIRQSSRAIPAVLIIRYTLHYKTAL